MYRFLICILIIFLGFNSTLKAQNSVATADTLKLTEYAFVPALSYNTDFGLIFGGLMNRYDYSKSRNPYSSFIGVNSILSTEGLFLFNLTQDYPNFQDRNFRLTHILSLSRFFEDNYFGIAQNQKLNPTFEDNPELYTFNSFSIRSDLQYRKALRYYSGSNRLEFIFQNIFTYETPFDNEAGRLITTQPPLGFEGGSTNLIFVGGILERRDSEILTTRGTFTRITTGPSIKNFGSKYNLYQNWIEHRSYATLQFPFEFIFAHRIIWSNTSGDTPYWALPTLGGQDNLRGYPDSRFLNENYIIMNTELRKWLGKVPFLDTAFGGVLFVDAGRSFSNDEFYTMFEDIKVTYGFSTLLSLFTPDFFLRGDFGFSEEGLGVYVGVGFLF